MSGPLDVLLRVKVLKEGQALRDAHAKRETAARAAEATERARATVRESAATLESRQDAIYNQILGRIVCLDEIEDTKGQVVKIEKEHTRLVDAEDRAAHVQAEAEAAREAAIQHHRRSLRHVDKYVLLTEREREEHEAYLQLREEIEIEDMFSTNRRGKL